jgi:hypothetical protein
MEPATPHTLQWDISVPLFGNIVILRQLGWSIGLPFGIVTTLILVLAEGSDRLYALALLAALFLLTAIFLLGFYGGKADTVFTLDADGVRCAFQPGQANRNAFLNGLTVLLGLLSNQPAAAGAGMLAQARQAVRLPWKHVRQVKTFPTHRTILLRGRPGESVAIFCSAENYPAVLAMIAAYAPIRS